MARGSLPLGSPGGLKLQTSLSKPAVIKASKVGIEPEVEEEVELFFGGAATAHSHFKNPAKLEKLAPAKVLNDGPTSSPRSTDPVAESKGRTERKRVPGEGATFVAQSLRGSSENAGLVEVTSSTQLNHVELEGESKPGGKRQYSSPVNSGTFLPTAEGKVPGHLRAIQFGPKGSLKYRMVFVKGRRETSPWHIIPLYGPDCLLNCICTTPAGNWLRMEVAQAEPFTPLKLAKKKGKPARYSENVPWNLGILPQTWADPEQPVDSAVTSCDIWTGPDRKASKGVKAGGFSNDGRPLEVIEVGDTGSKRRLGEVYLVKPLGTFAVVEGQTVSWKIIAIDEADSRADELQDVRDLEKMMPGKLGEIREWLRTCLCTDPGDLERGVALNGQAASLESAARGLAEAHAAWQLYTHQMEPHVSVLENVGLSASTLEKHWIPYTVLESDVCLPPSGSNATAQASYDKAWASLADAAEESASPKIGIMESPSQSKYANILSGLKGGKRGEFRKGKHHQPLMHSLICGSDQFAGVDSMIDEEWYTPTATPGKANGSSPAPMRKKDKDVNSPAVSTPEVRDHSNKVLKSPSFFTPNMSPASGSSPARVTPSCEGSPLRNASGKASRHARSASVGSPGKEMDGLTTSFDELGGAHGVWLPTVSGSEQNGNKKQEKGAGGELGTRASANMCAEAKASLPAGRAEDSRAPGGAREDASSQSEGMGNEEDKKRHGLATAGVVQSADEQQCTRVATGGSSALEGAEQKQTMAKQKKQSREQSDESKQDENLYNSMDLPVASFPQEEFDDPDIPVAMVADDYAVAEVFEAGVVIDGKDLETAYALTPGSGEQETVVSPAGRRPGRPPRPPSSLKPRSNRNSFEDPLSSAKDNAPSPRRRVSFCPVVEVVTFSTENSVS